MGYYISHMIGIRTGGVFSDPIDMNELEKRISKIIKELKNTEYKVDMEDSPAHCLSKELTTHKGSYVVLAGVFNYWNFDEAEEFVKKLSQEFQAEVLHMAWDEQTNKVQCQIWLAGKRLFETSENPIGRVLRRVV